jgi:spermidine synthase
VEIVPEVYNCFAFFHADGARILADPRIHYFGDDGRNFMLMRPEKYDVITMDPAPPLFSAGTVNLYTVEFFKLCRNRLRSGGIMCLWIPPDRFPEIRMIMKSFYAVFPDCLVWGGPIYPGMYLTGFNGPIQFDQQRFFQADQDTAIVADLNEWNNRIPKPSAMLGLLILSQKQLSAFLQGARIVTDDVPYTEFPLWRAQFDPTYQWRLNALSLTQWRDRTFKTNADSMAGQQVP